LLAPIWHKIYDQLKAKSRKSFYSDFIKPGDLCFDIGANVGNRTAIFLSLQARVIAIEPQPACVQKLKNRFGNQINIIPKGLGSEQGVLPMHISDASTLSTFSEEWINELGSNRFSGYEWKETIDVEITTLDQLIAEYGVPHFCKIDVEGYELNVIKGLSCPIPHLSFEYAVPENMKNLLATIDALIAISSTAAFNYSVLESMQLVLPTYVNAIALKKIIESETFVKTGFGDIYVKMPN
ncbi:FkbM family methyltransferase, partial [Nostoc sp. CHAB 5834]|nr:FkbM family methyltransferase [Nostoc sp. CHAB 5834]